MIDWVKFNEYLGSSLEPALILKVAIDPFIKDCPEKILSLRQAVEEKDFPKVDNISHQLKSNLALFGDWESAKLAFNLELMGRYQMDNNVKLKSTEAWNSPKLMDEIISLPQEGKMDELFDQFVKAIEKLIVELKQYRKKHSK